MQKEQKQNKRNLESGQSLIEMALAFTLLLIFLLGMLDLGRMYFIYVAMEDGAGEAALYLALNAACPEDTGGECADPNNAMYRAENASSQQINFSWDAVRMDYAFIDATVDTEAMVQVGIEYDFDLMAPIISDIVGNGFFTLRAEAIHVRILE